MAGWWQKIIPSKNDRELKRIKRATGYKDIKPITLLGASTWNHPYLSKKCQQYCENAIFVDGYYRDHPAPLVRDFDSAFREIFGKSPQLSDAQAFDTAGIVRAILELTKTPLKSREDLRSTGSKVSLQVPDGTKAVVHSYRYMLLEG